MNPLLTTKAETFRSGTDNLEFYHNRLIKLTNGVLLFCSGGEAEITIDLEKHHIIPNTNIMLLPGSILSLRSASPDFQIHYFAYSGEMMKVACFRLDPAFIHFMKENSCYTHTRLETIRPILRMIEASAAIYADKIAVDEETVRLRSHLAQLDTMLTDGGAIGRKLDFLLQELNREANTIGSKGNDIEQARTVVAIKAELEKIREQTQNIE
mgnify:CR=1 FL=1